MARKRSSLRYLLEYYAIRTAISFLQVLPLDWATALVKGCARLVCRFNRRHREVALDNLRHAFPGRYTEDQLQRLVRTVYEHLCLVCYECVLMPRKLHRHNWRRYIAHPPMQTFDNLLQAHKAGRPALLVTAHFGNWEMAAMGLALSGFKTDIVARSLDNPYLDRLLKTWRERHGHRLLDKNHDVEQIEKVMDSAGTLCTLADQDAGRRGLFVNFFGRPASTHKGIALLALRYGAHILVAGTYRTGGVLQYTLQCTDSFSATEYADSPRGVYLVTQRITSALERLVHLAPEQYFWLHRRWKHQPPEKKKAA